MNSIKVALLPYKPQSQSAKNLQESLQTALNLPIRRLFTDERGTLVAQARNHIINWGSSSAPDRLAGATWINHPIDVKRAGNKLWTFNQFDTDEGEGRVSYPEYTTEYDKAVEWVTSGSVVVCRTKLNGHSGAGIVLAAREEDVVQNCPLYVKYVKKAKEFRVHVAFNEVIDVQAKRKRQDYEGETDYAIRNHHTGWVYCREDITEPADLREQALRAILTLGLDFGAVDIIYNQHYNKCYVLEVNTAPGLQGTTVESYRDAFIKHLTKD